MDWIKVSEIDSDIKISKKNFWSSMKVWIERPHVLNTKILIAELCKAWKDILVDNELLETLLKGVFNFETMQKLFKGTYEYHILNKDSDIESNIDCKNTLLIIRSLHPKHFKMFHEVLDVVILDYVEDSVSFYPNIIDAVESPIIPAFAHKFKLVKNSIILEIQQSTPEMRTPNPDTLSWLSTKVMPKLLKWSQSIPDYPIVPSLQLVSAKDYNSNLFYLKSKYAKKFLEIWPHYNNTDPKKYVYEDISIAAYLITLWAEERNSLCLSRKQTFVDLGCGNGLLDHILSSEGHEGIGIDLRRRKIWSVYGDETKLLEAVIEPSDKQLYPNYDWIIGNHADELTPWIPVIAARSSYNTKAFILPCCFYTFNGKFVRPSPSVAQYKSYLDFIKELCTVMGFQAQLDKLRIPSTKRTCIVCTSRTYNEEDENYIDSNRQKFIHTNSKQNVPAKGENSVNAMSVDETVLMDTASTEKWIVDFIPRKAVEKVQNCSRMDKETIDSIIGRLFNHLLSYENYVTVIRKESTISWNKGGYIKINELPRLFEPDVLKVLKAQRGGFRTLLRNHGDIFQVQGDDIQLRQPLVKVSNDGNSVHYQEKNNHYKWRTCFFNYNHPQGCPLSEQDCKFQHI